MSGRSGTVSRDDLVAYLDEYLAAGEGQDFGPNGLQVEGREEIRHIVSGVSGCVELFEQAVERDADAVLVHHGIFWEGMPRQLTGFLAARVRPLIRSDLNLLAYHLPLDRHPEVGNNAVAARKLGLVDLEPFAEYHGLPVGFRGRFPQPIEEAELRQRLTRLYEREPLVFPAGPAQVETVGIISGGAQGEIHQAIAAGLDSYVTGEVSEWVMNIARESGIHFYSCGHYATERAGVQALGDHLRQKFGLRIEFIDVDNPV